MKSIKIRDPTPHSDHNPNTPFIMVLVEENKSGKLGSQEVREGTASMPLDEFLYFLHYTEKNIVWWSFKMHNLIGKGEGEKQI